MSYEVWIFSDKPEYKPRGRVVAIEECPHTYTKADAEAYAVKLAEQHRFNHTDDTVTTLVREEASY